MSKIIDIYKKNIIVRYDKDPALPYYSYLDFKGLQMEEFSFINSDNDEVKYFYYYYPNYRTDKVVLFCHGMGPGHTGFLKEIELLARHGYKVLTLDYAGCGASGGDKMESMNAPTRDVAELLKHLNLKEEIMVIGHSLGAYTALNTINLHKDIKTGVIISGFLSIYLEMKGMVGFPFVARKVARFERGLLPEYASINNETFLYKTDKNIMMIHSKDDMMVKYKYATKIVEKYKNPHLKFLIVNGYKHNPHYSLDAATYFTHTIIEYNKLIRKGVLNTPEKRKEYFSKISLERLTEQNEEVWEKIFEHLDN